MVDAHDRGRSERRGAHRDHRRGVVDRLDERRRRRHGRSAGLATTWLVEYGTTSALGSQTTAHSAGNGTTPVDVSQQLTGLQAGTTYHLPRPRLQLGRGGRRCGGDVHDHRRDGPGRDHGRGEPDRAVPRHRRGNGRPERRLATDWYVEYGTTTSYGSRTTTRSAGSGPSAVARLGRPHRAPGGDDLQLSLRCRRRRGHLARREPDVPNRPGAVGLDRVGAGHQADLGAAHGHRRPERPLGDRVVRVRHDHARSGRRRPSARSVAGTQGSRSPRRSTGSRSARSSTTARWAAATPGRPTARRGASRTSAGPTVVDRCGVVDPRQRGNGQRHRQPERARDELVVRVGPDELYGQRTPVGSAGSGTATVTVTAQLTGLARTRQPSTSVSSPRARAGGSPGAGVSFRRRRRRRRSTGKVAPSGDRAGDAQRPRRPGRVGDELVVRVRTLAVARASHRGSAPFSRAPRPASTATAHGSHRRRSLLVPARRARAPAGDRTARSSRSAPAPVPRDPGGPSSALHDRRHRRARRPPRDLPARRHLWARRRRSAVRARRQRRPLRWRRERPARGRARRRPRLRRRRARRPDRRRRAAIGSTAVPGTICSSPATAAATSSSAGRGGTRGSSIGSTGRHRSNAVAAESSQD